MSSLVAKKLKVLQNKAHAWIISLINILRGEIPCWSSLTWYWELNKSFFALSCCSFLFSIFVQAYKVLFLRNKANWILFTVWDWFSIHILLNDDCDENTSRSVISSLFHHNNNHQNILKRQRKKKSNEYTHDQLITIILSRSFLKSLKINK